MRLYLARHGNTFRDADTPVFVGREEDLPLVEEGRRQAERLGRYCIASEIDFQDACAASLRRTQEFAQIVLQTSHQSCSLVQDSRLDEISYGVWGGKSSEEIHAMGYGNELQAWRSKGVWPADIFPETEASVRLRVAEVLRSWSLSPEEHATFLVSSNGILRYFLYAVPGLFEQMQREGNLLMKTGALSLLEYSQGAWQLSFWNKTVPE